MTIKIEITAENHEEMIRKVGELAAAMSSAVAPAPLKVYKKAKAKPADGAPTAGEAMDEAIEEVENEADNEADHAKAMALAAKLYERKELREKLRAVLGHFGIERFGQIPTARGSEFLAQIKTVEAAL